MLLLAACGAASARETPSPSLLVIEGPRDIELPTELFPLARRTETDVDAQRVVEHARWEVAPSSLQLGATDACVVAEHARHLLERGTAPDAMLLRFIEVRCGRALFSPDYEPGLLNPVDGFVVLDVPPPADVMPIRGRITHGVAGVAECQSTYAARRFAVRCPYDAADASEVIELVLLSPDDIHFGTTDLLVLRDPMSLRTFETQPPCGSAEALSVSVAERINAARASMDLAPLRYEAAQSAMNRQLARAEFEIEYEGGYHHIPVRSRDVARAGWEVPITLADGHALTAETPLGACADAMAARFLRTPSERDILLSRTATHLAVGVRFGPNAQQSIVTTYEAFEPIAPEVARAQIITELQRTRLRDDRAPLTIAPMPAPLLWALEQIERGASASATLRRAREDLGEVPEGTRLILHAAATPSAPPYAHLDDASTVAVAVTPRRARASARGEYLMFVLVGL